MDNDALVENLRAVIGLDQETCKSLLEQCGYDLERTIHNFYDQPVPQPAFLASAQREMAQQTSTPTPPQESGSNLRMLKFNCSYGDLSKEIVLDDSSCLGDLKQIVSLELSIPPECVHFVDWPPSQSPVRNPTENTRLSALSLPLMNEIAVANFSMDQSRNAPNNFNPNHFGDMDVEFDDLNRKHPIEVHNAESKENYKFDCDGVKTLGELKEDVARMSNISKPLQLWEGVLASQDDNNTLSSILAKCGSNKFIFRRNPQYLTSAGFNPPISTSTAALAGTSDTHLPRFVSTSTSATSTSVGSPLPNLRRPTFPVSINYPANGRNSSRRSSNGVTSPLMDLNNGITSGGIIDGDSDDNYDSDDNNGYFDTFMDNDFSFRSNSSMMPENAEDEKAALEQFKTEFVQRYGQNGPNFNTQALSAVIQQAFGGLARSRKPLAIYLHNDKSISANVFCSQILCKEAVSSFLNGNFVCWAWDMTSDANKVRFMDSCVRHFGSGVAESVREIKVDNYPLVILVQGKGRTCDVNGILQGHMDTSEMMAHLMRVHEQCEHDREQDIREERARQDREKIIMEQEEAYQRSLEIDRQKRIQKEQDELRIENENRRKQDAEQVKQEEIARLRSLVPPEPTAKSGKVCQIRFRTPTGEYINRAFAASDPVQSLIDYAGAQGYLSTQYQIIKSFPKTNISGLDRTLSLDASGIHAREAVTIEEICDEDDSDEE